MVQILHFSQNNSFVDKINWKRKNKFSNEYYNKIYASSAGYSLDKIQIHVAR